MPEEGCKNCERKLKKVVKASNEDQRRILKKKEHHIEHLKRRVRVLEVGIKKIQEKWKEEEMKEITANRARKVTPKQ